MKHFLPSGLRNALALLFVFFCSASMAQQVSLGTGGSNGLYWKFGQELSAACGAEVGFKAIPQDAGTEGNVNAALSNEIPWFIGQLDYLARRGQEEDLTSLQALLPLFPEQALVLTRSDVVAKSGGWNIGGFNVGGSSKPLASVTELAGRKVVTFGGAKATTELLRLQGGVQFSEIVAATNWDAAYGQLMDPKSGVDALILVQGKGTKGNLRGLPDQVAKTLRLLEIPSDVTSRFKIYSPDTATYPFMGSVKTMSVMSALFTKAYKKGPMVAKTAALKDCALRTAEINADTPGSSPAWGMIKSKAAIPWQTWEAPEAPKAPAKK